MRLEDHIRHIPGFPREGILFHDIMPMLQDPEALRYAVDKLADYARGRQVDLILGAEARGFILGAALAYALGVGFAAARKPGKLPWTVNRCEYDLEYGKDALEMHADAIKPGQRVLIHDDLLATGGTAEAKIRLVEGAGGIVAGLAFLIELTELRGRDRLQGYDVFSLLSYEV
ncbi:MAG: adenine phosphoribosyltransferase [Actinobacteria bacterium]|nr:adenine phosphoribosyltransferase [Actinomycetota bacterium]